ncbi:MAG: delta-60 repeat domain-containing protein, partial [Prosthecobacter sp.]
MKVFRLPFLAMWMALMAGGIHAAPGDLDTLFGTAGKVTTSIGGGDDRGHAVVMQSDGKLVVAGYYYNGSNNDFAVVRYNADGTLDTSFNGTGKATCDFG